MSLVFLLTWFAGLSFVGTFVSSRVPLWLPVGALVALQFLTLYPVR